LINAQHSEIVACLKGIEYAAWMGIQRIILETDAMLVANAIRAPILDRSPLSTMFREIRARMLSDFVDCSCFSLPSDF
jgi:ribonuclease HI